MRRIHPKCGNRSDQSVVADILRQEPDEEEDDEGDGRRDGDHDGDHDGEDDGYSE